MVPIALSKSRIPCFTRSVYAVFTLSCLLRAPRQLLEHLVEGDFELIEKNEQVIDQIGRL
jgi:hypothetical protein